MPAAGIANAYKMPVQEGINTDISIQNGEAMPIHQGKYTDMPKQEE